MISKFLHGKYPIFNPIQQIQHRKAGSKSDHASGSNPDALCRTLLADPVNVIVAASNLDAFPRNLHAYPGNLHALPSNPDALLPYLYALSF